MYNIQYIYSVYIHYSHAYSPRMYSVHAVYVELSLTPIRTSFYLLDGFAKCIYHENRGNL